MIVYGEFVFYELIEMSRWIHKLWIHRHMNSYLWVCMISNSCMNSNWTCFQMTPRPNATHLETGLGLPACTYSSDSDKRRLWDCVTVTRHAIGKMVPASVNFKSLPQMSCQPECRSGSTWAASGGSVVTSSWENGQTQRRHCSEPESSAWVLSRAESLQTQSKAEPIWKTWI